VVVGPRSPVAELDLRTLRLRYRRVRGLDPSEAEITRVGPREWTGTHNPHSTSARDASVLRPGLIRVHVRESRLVERWAVSEFGRSVVLDTHRWQVRRLRPTESADRVGDLMLVNSRPQGKAFPPFRLEAYDRAGKMRYRIDGAPRRLFTWDLGAGLLYAGRTDGTMTHVFDASNGKLLRRIPPREFDFQFEQPVFRWIPPQG
jgi:hypothetical protein